MMRNQSIGYQSAIQWGPAGLLLLLTSNSLWAQHRSGDARGSDLSLSSPMATSVATTEGRRDRIPELRESIRRQQEQIERLRFAVEQLQEAVEKMQQFHPGLAVPAGPTASVQLASAKSPLPAREVSSPAAMQGVIPKQEVERPSNALEALAEQDRELQAKVNQLGLELKQTDESLFEKLRGLGNFDFSGDIRLRYEPFFGGTLSQNRHRERIRLRFNALATLSNELTGGFSLASNDERNPISSNQTLTDFFKRKPINIDRAFVQYKPNWFKPLALTGGKFPIPWYRTEMTFDNNLNPEGFSQVLSFDINNSALTRLKFVGFELPFHERRNFDDSFLFGGQVQTYWKFGASMNFAAYAGFYEWHRADPVLAAQVADTLSGNSNTNTAAPGNGFASKFGLLDLIGRLDINTGSSRWPLMLQLDFVNNTRACANVALTTCNSRDRSGWWAEGQLGRTSELHDIKFGYTFIRIEREAVLAAFNFSDLRQSTNVVTHRLNFGYQAYRNVTLNYTLLVGRALTTVSSPTEPWLKRMQFDAVYKF